MTIQRLFTVCCSNLYSSHLMLADWHSRWPNALFSDSWFLPISLIVSDILVTRINLLNIHNLLQLLFSILQLIKNHLNILQQFTDARFEDPHYQSIRPNKNEANLILQYISESRLSFNLSRTNEILTRISTLDDSIFDPSLHSSMVPTPGPIAPTS